MTQPESKGVRVLIVDDSAFMRKALTLMLEADPAIKVVGTASDGQEGIEKIAALKPDIVTMDIEMPRMDGLTALRHIMSKDPLPVMMISSLTTDGARATLEALEIGAVDFIPKSKSFVTLDIVSIKDELHAKIKDIARRKSLLMIKYRQQAFQRSARGTSASSPAKGSTLFAPVAPIRKREHAVHIVALGCSTGGPTALQEVLTRLPASLPVGMLIVQHMPPTFTKSLAERLNQLSPLAVREAVHGEPVEPGSVLIAPGGRQMTLNRAGGKATVVISDEPKGALYRPCVDVMMTSVARGYGNDILGVILTGMGNNGVVGVRQIKKQGGRVIAQDEATSVVYGMPRAVIEEKLADHVAPIEQIAYEIASYF